MATSKMDHVDDTTLANLSTRSVELLDRQRVMLEIQERMKGDDWESEFSMENVEAVCKKEREDLVGEWAKLNADCEEVGIPLASLTECSKDALNNFLRQNGQKPMS